jgi:hypothetical protein
VVICPKKEPQMPRTRISDFCGCVVCATCVFGPLAVGVLISHRSLGQTGHAQYYPGTVGKSWAQPPPPQVPQSPPVSLLFGAHIRTPATRMQRNPTIIFPLLPRGGDPGPTRNLLVSCSDVRSTPGKHGHSIQRQNCPSAP